MLFEHSHQGEKSSFTAEMGDDRLLTVAFTGTGEMSTTRAFVETMDKLVAAHLEHLVQSGVRTVHLEVDEGNAPALKLYARHGFRQVGERTGYYTRADGTRATALTMTAVLA